MAHTKRCTGSSTLLNWVITAPSCIYQVYVVVDGNPITTTQALNSGMTDTQIATILNSNRTGNTTGTISAQYVANDLVITINDIILATSSSGSHYVSASGTGFPCGDFQIPVSFLSCSIIPDRKKKRKAGIWAPTATLCFNRNYIEQVFPGSCQSGRIIYPSGKTPYVFSHLDENGNCCFKIK